MEKVLLARPRFEEIIYIHNLQTKLYNIEKDDENIQCCEWYQVKPQCQSVKMSPSKKDSFAVLILGQ